MNFLASTLIVFFFLLACSPAEKPVYKLTEDEHVNLLFDLHFADAILIELTPDQRDSVTQVYWQKMEERYGLDQDEIREEIKKLESDPEKMKLLIDRVRVMADSIPEN